MKFYISQFKYPSGRTAYRVNGNKNGIRIRENYPTKTEAEAAIAAHLIDLGNSETKKRTRVTHLSDDQLTDAEAAFEKLKESKTTISLLQMADYFLSTYRPAGKTAKLSDAFEDFIQAKRDKNLRERAIGDLKSRVGFLVKKCGDKKVSDITLDEVKAVVRSGSHPRTRNHHRATLSSFFTWAVNEGYCNENLAKRVPQAKVEAIEPEVLSIADLRTILEAALEHRKGTTVPYVALATFAALRPTEISRLTWGDIDFENRLIVVGSHVAKKRGRRTVEMSDNLLAWLGPYRFKSGPICGENFRKDFDAVKAAAGYGNPANDRQLQPWPHDVLRHTGISYHLARHENESKTAAWAGNSPDVIHNHYKGLVSKKAVEEFWSITPDSLKEQAEAAA